MGEPEADGSSNTTNSNNSNNHDNNTTIAAATRTVNDLTTEARLWEWMYGGAPGIPGTTPPLEPQSLETARQPQYPQDQAAMVRRARLREICQSIAAAQTCDVCGGGGEGEGVAARSTITPITSEGDMEGARVLAAKCARGHRLAICGVTGFAIMAPGVSRVCGVCQSRVLGWEFLLERILKPAGVGEEDVAVMKDEMWRDVCARCGGKYLD